MLDVSVVLPVYNEEESLPVLWPELRGVLEAAPITFEVIFVDDGSRDGSADIIRAFIEADPRVRLVRFKANAGETAATDAGFKAARGRLVVVMDADLQNDPNDIPSLLDHLERWDAVTGWRVKREDSLIRRISSRVGNRVRNALDQEAIQDSGCTFRAFRRECLGNLVLYRGFHRFIPTLLRMQGYRVIEVPVNHRPRRFGRSKYGIGNRALVGLQDLLLVRWMKDRILRYDIAEVVGGDGGSSPEARAAHGPGLEAHRPRDEGQRRQDEGRRPEQRAGGDESAPRMRILLIGLGRWGERHLRVLRELGVEVWVAEVAEDRRARARRHGVDPARLLADYRTALSGVDAVDIVTPADSHLTVALTALAAGRDCFVEKPVTLTAAEARILAARVETTSQIVQVGHIFRFHPAVATLRETLAAGRIGPIRYLTGRFAGFKRPRRDAGVTRTDAIHYFDLFATLVGRDPTAVTASLRDFLGRGLDDLSFTVVEYGGTPAFIEAGYFAPGAHRDCVIVGERGSLVADFTQSTVTAYPAEHRRAAASWEAIDAGKEVLPVEMAEPLRRELAAFCASVATRTRPSADVAAGLQALEVAEAAERSANLGRRVTLEELRGF